MQEVFKRSKLFLHYVSMGFLLWVILTYIFLFCVTLALLNSQESFLMVVLLRKFSYGGFLEFLQEYHTHQNKGFARDKRQDRDRKGSEFPN